jgi:hypothetical protein
MDPVSKAALVFVAVKAPIFPVPFATNPIDVALFVHAYPVPVPVKLMAVVDEPLQRNWFETAFTIGVGLIVNKKLWLTPRQLALPPTKFGITVSVATIGELVVLTLVKEAIFPVPLIGMPMEGVVFVQLYDVPFPLKTTAALAVLLHKTWLTGCTTAGVGLIVMVNDCDGPVQLTVFPVYIGVTVIVAVTGTKPVFIAVNGFIALLPLAESPIVGLLFTQE